MKSLREVLTEARENNVAVGHFNVSDSNQAWGIFRAAKSLDLPVIIGTSEGERDWFGAKAFVNFIKSIKEEYN